MYIFIRTSKAVEKCTNGRKKGGRKRKKIVANLESDDNNDDMEVEELATGDDILNSSANDFVDASKEATKVGTDVPNDDDHAGQRRKSTRIRRNLIIEAENQAKLEQKSREIELEQKTKNKRHSEHFFFLRF